jgi:ribonuclease H2 subunit A
MNSSKKNVNLNQLSHRAALELIRRAFDQGFNIKVIYVDTVGDPNKYRQYLI